MLTWVTKARQRQLVVNLGRWCQHLCWKARCSQMENCIFNPWGHNDMSSLHLIPLLSELIIHPAVTSVITFISIIKLNLICLLCMPFFLLGQSFYKPLLYIWQPLQGEVWLNLYYKSELFSIFHTLLRAEGDEGEEEFWGNPGCLIAAIWAAEIRGVWVWVCCRRAFPLLPEGSYMSVTP